MGAASPVPGYAGRSTAGTDTSSSERGCDSLGFWAGRKPGPDFPELSFLGQAFTWAGQGLGTWLSPQFLCCKEGRGDDQKKKQQPTPKKNPPNKPHAHKKQHPMTLNLCYMS